MTNLDRRDFLKAASAGLAGLLVPEWLSAEGLKHRHIDYSKIPVPKIGYFPIIKEPNLSGISLADRSTDIGRIQRALRWDNISRAVGQRYSMPHRVLLGMICVESEGDPTQPNRLGDGGVGLIHMQPLMAAAYGLKMITPSIRLRDFPQGRKIERAIDTVSADLKDLIGYDDRFHPIKNIDAAARMVCDHYERKHSWTNALKRYSGRKSYGQKVMNYVRELGSKRFMDGVREDFSRRNQNFRVDAMPLNFDRYRAVFRGLNKNYGLDAYTKLKRHPVQ